MQVCIQCPLFDVIISSSLLDLTLCGSDSSLDSIVLHLALSHIGLATTAVLYDAWFYFMINMCV